MLSIKNSKKFKKDLKKYIHNEEDRKKLNSIIKSLIEQKSLDIKFNDHALTGNWIGHRDCHVKPDLLLIYKIGKDTLYLERLGSHSELFN